MKQISVDDPRLDGLSFDKFDSYFRGNQWEAVPTPNRHGIMYHKKYEEFPEEITILLPRDFEFQDTPLRVAEAINQLSVIEQRDPLTIIQEITTDRKMVIDRAPKAADKLAGYLSRHEKPARLLAYTLTIAIALINIPLLFLSAISAINLPIQVLFPLTSCLTLLVVYLLRVPQQLNLHEDSHFSSTLMRNGNTSINTSLEKKIKKHDNDSD